MLGDGDQIKNCAQRGLTGCRWRVEGDLGAVRAEHGVPAASHPEGVQAVGVQVAHDGAGSVHPVRGPPQPAVLAVLLGRGLAQPEVRGQSTVSTPILHYRVTERLLCSAGTHLRYSRTWWSVGRWSSGSRQQIEASL